MLDTVARWGLRLIAAVIFVSGVLALISALTMNSVHVHSIGRRQSVYAFSGFEAFAVALLIFGVGCIALYAVAPLALRRPWWRLSSFSLIVVAALILIAQTALKLIA